MSRQKKNLELLYKRVRETEIETRRRSLKHQEAIEATLILLSDLTTIIFEMEREYRDYLAFQAEVNGNPEGGKR